MKENSFVDTVLLHSGENEEMLAVSEDQEGQLCLEVNDTEEQMNQLMEVMTNKMVSVNQRSKVKESVSGDVYLQSDSAQEDVEDSGSQPLLNASEMPRDDLNVEC
jgi:K+/H+ antiporter YhaU regulatory subunit KhtT